MTATVKFSQLPNLTTIQGNTTIPVVDTGNNYTVTTANLQAFIGTTTFALANGLSNVSIPVANGNVLIQTARIGAAAYSNAVFGNGVITFETNNGGGPGSYGLVNIFGGTTITGALNTGATTVGGNLAVTGNLSVAGQTIVSGTTINATAVSATGNIATATNVNALNVNTSGVTAGLVIASSVAISTNLSVAGTIQKLQTTITPSTSTGSPGQIAWDANYIYVCTATNTWKRVSLSSF